MAASLSSSYRWLLRRLVPGLRPSQYPFAETLEQELSRGVWLDIGCGRRPFPEWMDSYQQRCMARVQRVVGVDPDLWSLQHHDTYPDKVLGSGYSLPFRSQSFDLASANMVMEHLETPLTLLTEVKRVLRPRGRFLFHTVNRHHWAIAAAAKTPDWIKLPLVKLLENREPEDVFPTFYRFNDRQAVLQLARQSGFRVVSLQFVNSNAVTAALGPLSIFELLWLRLIRSPRFDAYRSNLIGVLEVPEAPEPKF